MLASCGGGVLLPNEVCSVPPAQMVPLCNINKLFICCFGFVQFVEFYYCCLRLEVGFAYFTNDAI